jgi:hypothetical protein
MAGREPLENLTAGKTTGSVFDGNVKIKRSARHGAVYVVKAVIFVEKVFDSGGNGQMAV